MSSTQGFNDVCVQEMGSMAMLLSFIKGPERGAEQPYVLGCGEQISFVLEGAQPEGLDMDGLFEMDREVFALILRAALEPLRH